MLEILPDKFTPLEQTVVGQAAELLKILLAGNRSVGQLYMELKTDNPRATFDSLAAALTFLFAAGAIFNNNGIVGRT